MAVRRIAGRFDVVGDVLQGDAPVRVDLRLDPLLLQTREERLGHRAVQAAALSAYARLQMVRLVESATVVSAVLRALVRMNDGTTWLPPLHGYQDGVKRELAIQGQTCGPADNLPREEADNDRQVAPSLPRADVGDGGYSERDGSETSTCRCSTLGIRTDDLLPTPK